MGDRITGYILLFLGIGIVFFTLFNVYRIFTKKAKPVQIFTFDAISLDLTNIAAQNAPQVKSGDLKTEILPADVLNTSLNLIAHLFLMGFVGSTGFKISHIGTLLIRPIKVTLKEKVV